MFGSAASGDTWRAADLLVVTRELLDRIAGDVRVVWRSA
jgi:predicted nucleotidyltransferase